LWPPKGESIEPMRRLVRMWTFLAIGGGVWMLGYYLPSYELIHMLPVLGLVRCPGRMVVLVDLALATLAAIAVHTHILNHAAPSPTAQSLKRGLESFSRVALPAAMLATLALVAAAGLMLRPIWPDVMPFFAGGAKQMVQAVWPPGPAVLVPVGLMILTALAVRFWARRPRPRTGLLVAMLLLDLFFITRFVDVPARVQWVATSKAPTERAHVVLTNGRLFAQDRDNTLIARDAFNGLPLWSAAVQKGNEFDWEYAVKVAALIVAKGERVYCLAGDGNRAVQRSKNACTPANPPAARSRTSRRPAGRIASAP
jgi:hypothetical protein